MKKSAFTIIEISILAVILVIVACLVIPFSIDDTKQASRVLEWRALQERITHAFSAAKAYGDSDRSKIEVYIMKSISDEEYNPIEPYKIKYMNGNKASCFGKFDKVYAVGEDNVIGFKWYEEGLREQKGLMFYDINGKKGPNRWGKDVFGVNIYEGKVEPLCARKPHNEIVADCSKDGTGCCCSYYYLVGGNF